MKSYLANRIQVVSVNGKLSNAAEINCEVPQGSILGPLLFLFFINDLPLMLSDNIYSTDLYADDTTITEQWKFSYRIITYIENERSFSS